MSKTVRLTMAQALTKAMSRQMTVIDGQTLPLFAGVWAIFGHGNVAGLGEALYAERKTLPTFRAHNEQAMAHAGIAFAKASRRRRFMAATTSIGPGATNMVTAAALAHVNRLPILLLPGDVFAGRAPDPVLQQIEDFGDGTLSANDCFKPVSRYFDRITRPEQIVPAFERAMAVLTDPAECGPVTLSLCQDVQTEAFECPVHFLQERIWTPRRLGSDRNELQRAAARLRHAEKPLVIIGGGVFYAEAEQQVQAFCEKHGLPIAVTQAGKGSIRDDHPLMMGSLGVTGTQCANQLAKDADVVLALGTRLQDFTTGSRALFQNPDRCLIGLNCAAFDAHKHGALPLVCDLLRGITELSDALGDYHAPQIWSERASALNHDWKQTVAAVIAAPKETKETPTDAHVIGAVLRTSQQADVVVCAAGGLPGELHKLWQVKQAGGYHLEYGYSCMGYEIAGGLGVKMADPSRQVTVMVGDGSYLMMNSEIATSVAMGLKLVIVVLDNRGFGCINRLQAATGGAAFNNLWQDSWQTADISIDFAAHARAMGAESCHVDNIDALEQALGRARAADKTQVIVINTDPVRSTAAGGHWWDVAVPEHSDRHAVLEARNQYAAALNTRSQL
jgi:3D-(3,5/4)-trihydroxycyclohexane-1,2-dione acylhydrolase (decyclizing)